MLTLLRLPLLACDRGINVLILWSEAAERGYTSPNWMTYRQAQALGGHVRKGEAADPAKVLESLRLLLLIGPASDHEPCPVNDDVMAIAAGFLQLARNGVQNRRCHLCETGVSEGLAYGHVPDREAPGLGPNWRGGDEPYVGPEVARRSIPGLRGGPRLQENLGQRCKSGRVCHSRRL